MTSSPTMRKMVAKISGGLHFCNKQKQLSAVNFQSDKQTAYNQILYGVGSNNNAVAI